MDLTPKQQTSEAIRQAETILIITGQHPSVDQAAAVIALSAILRKFGKQTTAVVTDNPPAAVQSLDTSVIERGLGGSRDFVLKVDVSKVEVDKLRYEVQDGRLNIYLTPFQGSFAPSDVTFDYGAVAAHYDLVIVLGVPTRARIDKVYEQNAALFETIPMVNLDFHRSNENYGAVNLIEPNASSLCEMLVALSESLQSGIVDAEIATALLMGIVGSTDRFTAAHTSPKSLTVAAQMMAAGAKQQAVVKALYRDGRGERGERQERGDRGQDRSERQERAERGQDRDRGDRNNSHDRGQRSGQSRQESQRQERQPEPREPRESRVEARPQEPVRASEPTSRVQEPVAALPSQEPAPRVQEPAARPQEPVVAEELPIIQPSHIELTPPAPMEQVATAQPASAQVENPAQMALTQPEPAQPEPVQSEPERTSSDRPQMPSADFAAAAEMFSAMPAAADVKNQPEQS